MEFPGHSGNASGNASRATRREFGVVWGPPALESSGLQDAVRTSHAAMRMAEVLSCKLLIDSQVAVDTTYGGLKPTKTGTLQKNVWTPLILKRASGLLSRTS